MKNKSFNNKETWYSLQGLAMTKYRKKGLVFSQGTGSAEEEIRWIACHVCKLPFSAFAKVRNRFALDKEKREFWSIVGKRVQTDKPLAYLLREAWFAKRKYYVDNRVLIPRSPFAEVIPKHMGRYLVGPPSSMLEIGTGSGCMAITAAMFFKHARIVATDISGSALQVALINIKNYKLTSRISLIRSDCFSAIPKGGYDVIFSNPPYVKEKEYVVLPKCFSYEPRRALVSEVDDLRVVCSIIYHAADYLSEVGVLFLEVGDRYKEVMRRFPQVSFSTVPLKHGGSGVLVATKQQLDRLRGQRVK
ncbi:MAG: 50S ribosomal protein L3 N(5)-glutamine methyltransferase [Methylacidiphilales bacterium]|nr:50S ribosomal protein L3 N(5)-glutamine methyltransferase [Candidatus Methylacidiphilales bacterium]